MDLHTYLLIWICVIGLCMGSFFNVVILRSLSGESIVFPPSKCPKCGNKLYFWHNIPVLSYIILRGKCYFCKEKISIQYPIIEILTMILYGVSFLKFGISYVTIFVLLWLSCLLIMTVTDIKEKIVDCNLAILIGVSALIYAGISSGLHGFLHSVLGLIAGVAVMEIIARSGFIFAKARAMGEADTYVAGALGAIFGIFSIVKVLLLSLFLSAIFVIPLFLIKRFQKNDKYTLVMTALFAISGIVFKTLWQNYISLSIFCIIGLGLIYGVLKGIRQEENRSYLPYVPALATAGAIGLFYIW